MGKKRIGTKSQQKAAKKAVKQYKKTSGKAPTGWNMNMRNGMGYATRRGATTDVGFKKPKRKSK